MLNNPFNAYHDRHEAANGHIPITLWWVIWFLGVLIVALTQAAAEESGIEFRVAANEMHNWLSGRTYAETAAWAKVLIDKRTDRIIGVHILGHAGEELIHIFALAMKHGITASEVADLVYGFPTFSADIKSMW